MYQKGEVVYYKSIFGLKEATIIDKKTIRTFYSYGYFEYSYEYIIEFSNGKKKIVKENQLF